MEQRDTKALAKKSAIVFFYDDFVEFQDNCSFLCEALACMVDEQEQFDHSTTLGIKRYCYWIKDRVQELKEELSRIQKHLSTEEAANDPKHDA